MLKVFLSARRGGGSLLRTAGRRLPGSNSLSFASPKESKQRKGDPGCCVPFASLRGNLRCSVQTGSKTTRFAQTSFCPDPSGPPLLGASTRGWEKKNRTAEIQAQIPEETRARHSVSLFVFVPAPVPDCPLWMRRGAQVQADQGSRCLSEASLARPRLNRAPQVARSEAEGRRSQGRLSFGYFSLAKQRKVPRPPGRDPASKPMQRGGVRKPAQDPGGGQQETPC
jgi:hypothetical protein